MRSWSHLMLRHRRIVGLAWLVLFVAGAAASSQVTGRLSMQFDDPGASSYQANLNILRLYGNGAQGYPDIVVVNAPPGATVTQPGVRDQLAASAAAVSALGPFRVASYANTGDSRLLSSDGGSELVLVFLPAYSEVDAPPFGPQILRAMRPALPPGARLSLTGLGELIAGGTTQRADVGAPTEIVLGGLGALAVLAVVFGSLLALVPLLIASVAILTAFLVVLGITEITSVSFIAEYLIGLIGLGVSIDYSLLVVTRWREERALGAAPDDAIHQAMATAGRSVLFSGLIVAIGLLALVLVPVPFVRSLGYAGMLIPLVSVAVTIMLLPVLLRQIGPRMEWPRRRPTSGLSRRWSAWASGVVRHRLVAATGALVVLVLLAVNALNLQVGEPRADALANSGAATDGLRALEHARFPLGILSPVEVLVPDGASAARIASGEDGRDGVYASVAPSGSAWHRAGTAVVDVFPRDEASTSAGGAELTGIRHFLASAGSAAEIGGPGVALADESSAFYGDFPLVLVVVGVTTLLLLLRVFRSPILAVKAVVLNVISIGATYGVVVLVWQEGHGSQLIWGVPATGSVVNWGPLMIFAFLFGLSMDYEVFILTRIREEYERTGSTTEAIVRGVGRTGRLVTSAALILCLAFIALSASPETDLKIVATGLAAGIVLDATVVRALLVPALISLLGEWNWWLPHWMARALRISPVHVTVS